MSERDKLSWADALAAVGHAFTREQRLNGWPERLTPLQAAWLQRPGCRTDKLASARAQALATTLQDAVERRALKAEIETVKIDARPDRLHPTQRRDVYGQRVMLYVPSREARTIKTFWLQPANVIAYLRDRLTEEPSAHVHAWAAACTGLRTESEADRHRRWLELFQERAAEMERRGVRVNKTAIYKGIAALDGAVGYDAVRKAVDKLMSQESRRVVRSATRRSAWCPT